MCYTQSVVTQEIVLTLMMTNNMLFDGMLLPASLAGDVLCKADACFCAECV